MRENRLRKNAEFRLVYKKGKSFSNSLLVLYVLKNNKEVNRVGIAVSKKVGKSVTRSRVKRLIGESTRLNKDGIKSGYDLVFIARNASKDKSYKEIESSVKYLFKKSGISNVEKNITNSN